MGRCSACRCEMSFMARTVGAVQPSSVLLNWKIVTPVWVNEKPAQKMCGGMERRKGNQTIEKPSWQNRATRSLCGQPFTHGLRLAVPQRCQSIRAIGRVSMAYDV